MNDNDLVTIRSFATELEARTACAYLEAAGIDVVLNATTSPAFQGLQLSDVKPNLQVRPEDAEKTQTLLAAMDASTTSTEATTPLIRRQRASGSAFWIFVAVLILVVIAIYASQYRRPSTFTGMRTRDSNHDGRPDHWVHYLNGQATAMEEDRNFDGKPDLWVTYQNGATDHAEFDYNFDGKPDVWVQYSNGMTATTDVDADYDGIPDFHGIYVSGVIAEGYWHLPTGAVFKKDIYQYGRRNLEWIDEDGDGWFDKRLTYDAFDRVIRTESIHEAVPPPLSATGHSK